VESTLRNSGGRRLVEFGHFTTCIALIVALWTTAAALAATWIFLIP
jgi:hypothetical protein